VTAVRAPGSNLLVDLRRARDHVDRNYAAALDLAQLAVVAGVSKYHFVRCFEVAYRHHDGGGVPLGDHRP
jgi:AraC-like DNA-binding protein